MMISPGRRCSGLCTFVPKFEVWVSSAHPWHQLHPDTQKFDKGPSTEVRAPIEAYFAARAKA
jgi:hypothetical protein